MQLYLNSRSILPLIFFVSLLNSQYALADQQDFVLTAPDSKELAQGSYEELADSIARVTITSQGRRFSGTGVISKSLAKPAKDLRADRAIMTTKHKKRVSVELVATDGAKLDCELNMKYGDIWGQCVDPINQQIFSINNLTKDAK